MEKILVVVDMQTAFINQCGAQRIICNVVNKIEARKKEGYKIVLTVDKSGGTPEKSVLRACKGCKQYYKSSYGCKELILDLFKKDPDTVEFVGVCTDVCVLVNLLGTMAFLPFADIVLDSKCCAALDKKGHVAALRVMKACNVKIY